MVDIKYYFFAYLKMYPLYGIMVKILKNTREENLHAYA
jgi:hypothetical protein